MKLVKLIKNPSIIITRMNMKGLFNWMSDKAHISFLYLCYMHRKLDLKNPKSFNEKVQWLKLNCKNDELMNMVDKYNVREYISRQLGEEYLVPILGVWKSPNEIEFDKLPDKFVLKCTHDSGGVVICQDKKNFDTDKAKKKLTKALKRNYFYNTREYPYKNIQPRIIAEKFMDDGEGNVPNDYKILCFNGIPQNIMICTGRKNGHADYYFFDFEWNFLPYNKVDKLLPSNFSMPKPINLDKMYEFAKKLSKEYILSRIDFYEIQGHLYFGEITFFPASGYDRDITRETDLFFGKKIKLPIEN